MKTRTAIKAADSLTAAVSLAFACLTLCLSPNLLAQDKPAGPNPGSNFGASSDAASSGPNSSGGGPLSATIDETGGCGDILSALSNRTVPPRPAGPTFALWTTGIR